MASDSAIGDLLAGPFDLMAKKSAVKRQRRADMINQERLRKSWMASDLFLPEFGGGATGLLRDIGTDFRSLYDDIGTNTPSLSDSVGRFRTSADEFRPALDQSEEIGKSILSGEAGQQLIDLRKPVYEARNRAVATSKQGMQDAIAESLNRMEAMQRGRGFSGSSTAGDKVGASIRRDIARDVAGQQGAVDVANADDASRTAIAARDERMRAALNGLVQQLLTGRFNFETAPMDAALRNTIAPVNMFTQAVSPYIRANQPPVYMKKALPSNSQLNAGFMADQSRAIGSLAETALSMYLGGGLGGIMGGMGGGGGAAAPPASSVGGTPPAQARPGLYPTEYNFDAPGGYGNRYANYA